MAAKESDDRAEMFSAKRPRMDSESDPLAQRSCNKVAKSSEKGSEPSMGAVGVPTFNNRPFGAPPSEVGSASKNPSTQHRCNKNDGEKEEKQENQTILNKKNYKEDEPPTSMEAKNHPFNESVHHRPLFKEIGGDGGEQTPATIIPQQEWEEEKEKKKKTKKQNSNSEQKSISNSDEKEMDTKNISHDPDLDDQDDDDDLDNVSEISDFPGLDEDAWRPVSGPLNWVQRQMTMGRDPRMLFKEIISPDTFIPPDLDEMTLWGLLANFITEPPKRKKLPHFNTIEDVVDLLKCSKKIMVLTGAGVSVSCGIPDFRSRDGIYARLAVDFPDLPDPQAMFDINYFRNDPRPFFKFAKEIYPGQFEPSKCHKFIKLIEDHGRLLHNYTQNIDTLEQVAGLKKVIQCHGSFATATCMRCSFKLNAEAIRKDIFQQVIPKCPKCPSDCSTSIMKPDIVFFGENLPELFHYQMAEDKDQCDLLIVIGSSMKVRPVALIPNYIPAHVPQILINREPLNHMTFDVELLGDGDIIVNDLCKRLGDEWTKPFCDSGPAAVQITKAQLETSPSPSPTKNQSFGDSIQNKMEQNPKEQNPKEQNPKEQNPKEQNPKEQNPKEQNPKEQNPKGGCGLSSSVGGNDASKFPETPRLNSSPCKKAAENGSCSQIKSPNDSESSHTCERKNDNSKTEENGENVDNLKSLWKKNRHRKQSLARHLKDNQVLFLPPCQYAYQGAEICSDEEEDEEDDLDAFLRADSAESHDSESSSSSSSWESFSEEEEDEDKKEEKDKNKKSSTPNTKNVISKPAVLYSSIKSSSASSSAATSVGHPPHHPKPPAAAAAATSSADEVTKSSSSSSIAATDLKGCSSTPPPKSTPIFTKLQSCKSDGGQSSGCEDPFLQQLRKAGTETTAAEKRKGEGAGSKSIISSSSDVTLPEEGGSGGQCNGHTGASADTGRDRDEENKASSSSSSSSAAGFKEETVHEKSGNKEGGSLGAAADKAQPLKPQHIRTENLLTTSSSSSSSLPTSKTLHTTPMDTTDAGSSSSGRSKLTTLMEDGKKKR